jgi:hypothetical protein
VRRLFYAVRTFSGLATSGTTLLLLVLMAVPTIQPIGAQELTSSTLSVQLEDGSLRRYAAFPADGVGLLFPEGEALLNRELPLGNWTVPKAFLQQKIQFVSVSDTRKRFTLRGITYNDQLFLFDEFFCRQNPAVMSRLMQATSAFPKSRDEAFSFAQIYLAFTASGFKDPDRSIISSSSQIPPYPEGLPVPDINDVKDVIRPPVIHQTGNDFSADFFTTTLDRAWVQHHRMTIGPQGLQNVTDEVVFPDYFSSQILHKQIRKNSAKGSKARVLFQLSVMANGETSDGGALDLQTWAASDGPGLQRLHYYYKLPAHAETAWQEIVKNAISVTDDGPWLNEHGIIVGKKFLVIGVGFDKKTLWAMRAFKDESSVLEIVCACHSNLLASEAKPDFSNIVLP